MSGIRCFSRVVGVDIRANVKVHSRSVNKGILQFDKAHLSSSSIRKWISKVTSSTKNKQISKYSYTSPISLGSLSTLQLLLSDVIGGSSFDICDCLSSNDEDDTWSYL